MPVISLGEQMWCRAHSGDDRHPAAVRSTQAWEQNSIDESTGPRDAAVLVPLNQASEPARSPKNKSGLVKKADTAIREHQRQIQSTRVEIGHTYEESRREQTSWYEELSLQGGALRKNVLEEARLCFTLCTLGLALCWTVSASLQFERSRL